MSSLSISTGERIVSPWRTVRRAPRAMASRIVLIGCVVLSVAASSAAQDAADAPPEAGLSLLAVIEATLRHDPNLAVAENQVLSSEGALLVASSRFDPVLSSSVVQNDDRDATGTTSTLTSRVDVEGELRSGLSWQPQVSIERADGAGTLDSTSVVAFTLRQPLLRGRGRAVVTADEEAARRELAADRLDLEHRIAQRLQAVASRYWSARAAELDLVVLREAETRSRELLVTTERLIAADVTPAAEIVQLEADTTFREAARIAGERALFEARQALGREMGLDPPRIAGLETPADAFPTVPIDDVTLPDEDSIWIGRALARRADLRADRERLAAARLRLEAAENALRPQLDLVFTPSYAGRGDGRGVDGTLSSLFDDVPGLSTSLGLNWSWPLRNRRAAGARVQSRAAWTAVELAVESRTKAIGADVPVALDGVRQRARELERFSAAVVFFEKALENEIKKLRAGSSTLIDVLAQRDRLTSVQRTEITARLGLALAIAEVRFQTGTLVDAGVTLTQANTGITSALHLTTLPR